MLEVVERRLPGVDLQRAALHQRRSGPAGRRPPRAARRRRRAGRGRSGSRLLRPFQACFWKKHWPCGAAGAAQQRHRAVDDEAAPSAARPRRSSRRGPAWSRRRPASRSRSGWVRLAPAAAALGVGLDLAAPRGRSRAPACRRAGRGRRRGAGCPSAVQARNSTSATSSGLTQTTPRAASAASFSAKGGGLAAQRLQPRREVAGDRAAEAGADAAGMHERAVAVVAEHQRADEVASRPSRARSRRRRTPAGPSTST